MFAVTSSQLRFWLAHVHKRVVLLLKNFQDVMLLTPSHFHIKVFINSVIHFWGMKSCSICYSWHQKRPLSHMLQTYSASSMFMYSKSCYTLNKKIMKKVVLNWTQKVTSNTRPPYLSEQTSQPLSALIMFGVRPDHANDVQNFGQHGRDLFRLCLSQFFTRSFQCWQEL